MSIKDSNKRQYDLRILTANDVYKPARFSAFKTMIPQYQGKGVTKCVFPGDFLGGSLFSVSHEGKSMIEVCNEVGFDYVTLGNHEFDFGSEKLEGLMGQSNFKWLGSNVRYSDSNKIFSKVLDYDTFILPSKVASLRSDEVDLFIKVGVFGVCTQHTPELSNPTDAVVFEDVLQHTKRITQHLKNQEKCDLIIALTHVSLAEDKMIAEVGNIDLILGGHEHEPYILEHHEVLIMKCGQNLDYVGVIDFNIDCLFKKDKLNQYNKHMTYHRSLQLLSTYGVKTDPKIDEIILKWNNTPAIGDSNNQDHKDMEEVLTLVDYDSDRPLTTKTSECRQNETAFPCILADAYKWLFEQDGFRCDLAVQNGGFVRADSVYPAGTSITRGLIAEELPFVKKPVLIEMKGKDIIEAISDMLPKNANPTPIGSYPHLSAGISACYDLNYVENGRPAKVFDVKIGGEDLEMGKTYNVATTSFYVYEAADGVTAFNHKPILKEYDFLCSEAMCRYLVTQNSVSGVPPGRLINSTV